MSELKEGDKISGLIVLLHTTTRNEDTTEGRGKRVEHSFHLTNRSALIGARHIDVMGTDGQTSTRLALRLSDGRYFLIENDMKPIVVVTKEEDAAATAAVRENALKKLSEAEIAALGL